MGLWRYVDADNVKQLLAFDTERAAVYNTVSELFDPLDAADIFNSGLNPNTNYVTSGNWASTSSSTASPLYRLYFTNGKSNLGGTTDGIRVYDRSISTTATGQFNPNINSTAGVGGVEIRGAKLLFPMKQRLVLLHTFEGSTAYPQRARWCQAQNPDGTTAGGYPLSFAADTWNDAAAGSGGYVDAPTGEQIVSAQFVQNQLIVFFTESVWTLRPTSDPALPFRWDRINSFRACDSKMGTAGFDRYVTAFGVRGITSTDGVETKRFDERIEDFVTTEINASQFDKVFSKRSFSSRRLWTLYAQTSTESEDADHALIFDRESGAFSKYKIDMNVLGHGGVAKDFSLDDFPNTSDGKGTPIYLNGDEEADPDLIGPGESKINDFVFSEGADIFVGGDRSGVVHILEQDGGDSGTSIDFELYSAAWNPWMVEGTKCKLGYMDVFVDTHPSTQLTYEFYKDNDEFPYATVFSDMLPNLIEKAEIADISQANPAVVTANQSGLITGDQIYIYKVGGMFEVNGGPYTVTVVDSNRFSLDGVDSSAFTTFASGGVITELPFERTKTWKRIYAGGSGYQHRVRIVSEGIDKAVRIHAFMPYFAKTGRRTI